jgi:hypothetical protein
MIKVFQSPWLMNIRLILGEIAVGLLLSWWWLFCLELIRPGLVSLYLNLNVVLLLAAGAWAFGLRPKPLNRPYTGPIISGLLLVILGLTLSPNNGWLWLSLPLGIIAGLFWYVAQTVDLKD